MNEREGEISESICQNWTNDRKFIKYRTERSKPAELFPAKIIAQHVGNSFKCQTFSIVFILY